MVSHSTAARHAMADRSAVSTILGYFYQFDRSILTLLRLASDDDRVAIECIEDVDVHTATEVTAVQCKYYEKSEYNHSVIKPAIMFMLVHFKEGQDAGRPPINYHLAGHFESGHDKLSLPIDIQFLKDNFLTVVAKKVTTKKHEELGVSDAQLAEFLAHLTIDIRAERFDNQFSAIVTAVTAHFECSPFAAEFFFYNNALRVIKELAINPVDSQRVITKREFLRRIDTSSLLFDEWFVAKRGKAQHYARLRTQYFSPINLDPADRLFIVHIDPATYDRGSMKALMRIVTRKYAKLSRRDRRPFSPYVLVVGLPDAELVGLKQELYNENLPFADGHNFKGAAFDPASISRPAASDTGPHLRIFGSVEEARQTFASFKRVREIYEFYRDAPVTPFSDTAIGHVRIQVPDYPDIANII